MVLFDWSLVNIWVLIVKTYVQLQFSNTSLDSGFRRYLGHWRSIWAKGNNQAVSMCPLLLLSPLLAVVDPCLLMHAACHLLLKVFLTAYITAKIWPWQALVSPYWKEHAERQHLVYNSQCIWSSMGLFLGRKTCGNCVYFEVL